MSQTIDIYVSAGQMSSPFYTFYTDDAGRQELTHLKIGTTYTFHRLHDATTHPFYISDVGYKQESTSSITLSGNGDASSGITGTETLTLVIHEHVTNLYYYCTTHSVTPTGDPMISEFSVSWQPQHKDELKTAVDLWISDNPTALTNYGDISTWDTSLITNMHNLFRSTTFNDDISSWDVSNVTNMQHMFAFTSINVDLSSWDVSSVITMENMFRANPVFNSDISSWVVSRVTNMSEMFRGARNFNQNISSWNVSSVITMENMFRANPDFNSDISSWDVSNVTNFSNMFHGATAFNHDISDWDVSSGTDFTNMFTNTAGTYENVSVNNKFPGTYWKNSNVKSVSTMVTFNIVLQKTPPVITLNGDATITHEPGTSYTDAEASAVNYMSSDISSHIVVSGDVNPNVFGSYTISYNVTDPLSGLTAAEVTRTVNVFPPALETSVDANNTMTIKIGYVNYTDSLTSVLNENNYNASVHNLVIEGYGENFSTWVDFQFHYGSNGEPVTLHIQNITLSTSTIDGYAVYSKNTLTTMSNVTITGYSGDTTAISTVSDWDNSGTAPSNVGRWAETGGGAMRIRGADYTESAHTSDNPTLSNVTVTNCCRGIRIQDTNGAYVMNCSVSNVSDNGIYFASGSYDSTSGCNNCTIDTCTTTDVGQCGLHNIGGYHNIFKNCTVNNTRGAGASIYNTNGSIIVYNCTFENANTQHTRTPWGGSTDDHNGAAFGMVVATTDTNAVVITASCTFVNGADSVYYKSSPGKLIAVGNTITEDGFPGGDIDAAADASTIMISELTLALSELNPVITLNGDATITHENGTPYNDAGASAVNYMSSDISSDIVVSGDVVDTSVNGTYTITYNVTDPLSGLSAAEVTRSVTIFSPSPLHGTSWKLRPVAGALKVGPTQGSGFWWSNNDNDLTTRAELFDDIIKFNTDGSYEHIMEGLTWIAWEGQDGYVGTPSYPHDGTDGTNTKSYTWSDDNNNLTLHGVGAHLGLAKVVNNGELSSATDAPTSITYMYNITSDGYLIIYIERSFGWWTFEYEQV
tara:strand:+ start:7134 stop:10244 length:3111 start_codon:yes stop_codon:yes gene_type:complete